ncbi:hypothetical protein [Companilactobacillus farciminis]|uniref:hypothetical protein n=1 Tax=Companilactobacillus farciminis TaxID=1612 RepID=UPI00241DB90D|nr:hypothetical protein [Companilactobacillus farciminis]
MRKRKLNLLELKKVNGGWNIKIPFEWKVVTNGWKHRKNIMSGIDEGINIGKGK